MLSLKNYVFSEKGDQTPIKTNGPGDPASQRTSVAVSSELCIQKSFRDAGWDGPTSQTTPASTWPLSWFSQGPPQRCHYPQTAGSSTKNNAHTPKRWVGGFGHLMVIDVCHYLVGVDYKLLLVMVRNKPKELDWKIFLKEKMGYTIKMMRYKNRLLNLL